MRRLYVNLVFVICLLALTTGMIFADIITFEERPKELPYHVQGKIFVWTDFGWAPAPIDTEVTVRFHSSQSQQYFQQVYYVETENGDFYGNMPGYDETDPDMVNEYNLAEFIFRGSSYFKYFYGSVNMWIYWHQAF